MRSPNALGPPVDEPMHRISGGANETLCVLRRVDFFGLLCRVTVDSFSLGKWALIRGIRRRFNSSIDFRKSLIFDGFAK